MIAFDTTFLIDYLEGEQACAQFLEEHRNNPFGIPTLALFEIFRGTTWTPDGPTIDRIQSGLEWAEPLPLSVGAARKAAKIDGELTARGQPVNLGDVIISGICQQYDAQLVTRDRHFERVPGLDTISY